MVLHFWWSTQWNTGNGCIHLLLSVYTGMFSSELSQSASAQSGAKLDKWWFNRINTQDVTCAVHAFSLCSFPSRANVSLSCQSLHCTSFSFIFSKELHTELFDGCGNRCRFLLLWSAACTGSHSAEVTANTKVTSCGKLSAATHVLLEPGNDTRLLMHVTRRYLVLSCYSQMPVK